MCGIVGAVAQRDVLPILLEGLKRLEYRGYDSAGLAILGRDGKLQRTRVLGKVAELSAATAAEPPVGGTGIAHTRWATHGRPSVDNAHPHVCREQIALVHNGIIENHETMRETLRGEGYEFGSQTDTEVIVNRVHAHHAGGRDLLAAVSATVAELHGAYAIGVIDTNEPNRLVAARRGSPLVVGVGIGEHFIASDVFALLPVTRQFIYLEDGDIVDIQRERITIYDHTGRVVERPVMTSELAADAVDKAGYRHYMLKEIFSQPAAVADTLTSRIEHGQVLDTAFGMAASDIFSRTEHVHIVACGTSYHAGLVASYWIEALAGLTCRVEIASEYRYRAHVVPDNTLFVTLSQSGETADTLAALSLARELEYSACLAICNNPESSLTRESDLVFLTRAGPEIGVASTKAFTTQLVALLLLTIALGRHKRIDSEQEQRLVAELETLPGHINTALQLNDAIEQLSEEFSHKQHALYLGRGTMLPVAMEGALKLKEISYIHAEAYAAGELKHGPLALVDEDMPVIAVAPNDSLLEKLKSNLQEVRARGGVLYLFADSSAGVQAEDAVRVLSLARVPETIAPIVYTIPLQLFAYHIAVLKGADVDQPRNLAKSVTVE